ncbi:DsbA family protein [Rhodobacteraceae bacterium]|nr:DsbA family protein [Paracoccaceae bacterium]
MSETKTSRRGLFKVVGGLVAVAAGWQWVLNRPETLSFEPIKGLPEWRQVAFEGVTLPGGDPSAAVFLGIGDEERGTWPADQLCPALYPNPTDKLPVAVFTDVNCPNCRSLELKLDQRSDRLALTWIDLPLLGPTSEIAARAAIAASLQPGGDAFRARAQSRLRGNNLHPSVLEAAAIAGLDPDQLQTDFKGPKVSEILRRNHAMANTLGVWGTPAMAIGKTMIMGDLSRDTLDQLIDIEMERKGC